MLMQSEQSSLVLIDVQERLTPVMSDPRRVIHNCCLLVQFARRLGVPVIATEQYPKGLGPTMIDLRDLVTPEETIEKRHFSAADEPGFMARLRGQSRRQVVMAGVEAHVCVLQTALALAAEWDVFVVTEACASRRDSSEQLAWRRLSHAGVALVSVEMVLFEWLREAGTSEFKELSPFVR